MTNWYVIEGAGAPPRQVQSVDGEDVDGKTVTLMDRCGDLAIEKPEAGVWVPRMPELRERLAAQIDAQRERTQQAQLTPGSAKAMVYAQKARERDRFEELGAAAVAAMSPAEREQRFPAASAEASVTGEPVETVLARIVEASDRANAIVYQADAIATCAKARIRAATTAEEAHAAADVEWPGDPA